MRNAARMWTAALAMTALAAVGVQAQDVYFSGYTNGCFDCGPAGPASSDLYQTDNVGGLYYENASFDVWTVDGFAGIGVNADPYGAPRNQDNFGGFYLDPDMVYDYNGSEFWLRITFVDPSAHQELFSADLVGSVRVDPIRGGVSIDFADNGYQYWTVGAWKYGVQVNDVAIIADAEVSELGFVRAPITGSVVAVVPEPASVILMATGMLVLLGIAYRRRQNGLGELV